MKKEIQNIIYQGFPIYTVESIIRARQYPRRTGGSREKMTAGKSVTTFEYWREKTLPPARLYLRIQCVVAFLIFP